MLALIPLFPLIGFLLNGIWYAFFQAPEGRKSAGAGVTGTIATLAICASFVVSLICFLQLHGMGPEHRVLDQTLFSWITIGSAFNIELAFHLDSLSTLFTLVITGVGTLIHLYSVGYMGHDATPGKFFAYLNLFCFAMLLLVLGSSLPVMFLGWEGVGLCSYLLISYWYTDLDKAKAGKKAFVVNRVGDFGFLIGMFLLFSSFGTLDFQTLHQVVMHGAGAALGNTALPIDASMVTTACLLLFLGCCGKSAQIPLYVWLPDAMAGPTPVSALIHAATMVTSGIYMLARLNFLYDLSPTALHVVAAVGAVTAFFAATIALVQRDIKKVLAYSTVSQLGYMFLACGVGAYTAGVFHVITHAFFKALLFLGAGSVIHGMHEEQDIMRMGGLRTKMPKTFMTFAVAWLAISGIPPFAGFFSKDEILWQSFSSPLGNAGLWAIGAVTAFMTAFYMTRIFSLTFLGEPRFNEKELGGGDHGVAPANGAGHGHAAHHGSPHDSNDGDHPHAAPAGVHESPWTMTLPLGILAVLSVLGGFIGLPHHSWLETWLEPVIPVHEALGGPGGASQSLEPVLMGVSVVLAILGIGFALQLYRSLSKPEQWARTNAAVYGLLENKWYIDELYEAVIVRPIRKLSELAWKVFDVGVIDRFVLGIGKASEWTGQTVRVAQTGSIQLYGFALLLGIVVAVGYLIYGLA